MSTMQDEHEEELTEEELRRAAERGLSPEQAARDKRAAERGAP